MICGIPGESFPRAFYPLTAPVPVQEGSTGSRKEAGSVWELPAEGDAQSLTQTAELSKSGRLCLQPVITVPI